MIPLQRHRPPKFFNEKIRKPGRKYLREHGVKLNDIGVEEKKFYPYWKECKDYLGQLYEYHCAYTGSRIHKNAYLQVDHIKPKTLFPAYLAYEWRNYCLACEVINTKKKIRLDIIDPFSVTANLFYLILETGYIYANPSHPDYQAAQQTIDGLDLNNERWKDDRQEVYNNFKTSREKGLSLKYAEKLLKVENIFVWYEAKRQGKLL